MKFAEWFPYYQGIRAEFGYNSEQDQDAARILSGMIKKKALDPKLIQKKIKGKNVIVVGAGPSLEDEKVLKYIKKNKKFVKIAADGAVQFLIENKIFSIESIFTCKDMHISTFLYTQKQIHTVCTP